MSQPFLVMLTARVTALTVRQATPRLSKTALRAAPVSSSTPSQNLLQRLQAVAEDALKVAQETGPRARASAHGPGPARRPRDAPRAKD